MNSKSPFRTINELDLDPIKLKLMHKESGEGWSQAKADAAEFEYRRFLTLMKMFPQEQVSPLFEVDIFWHYHILDTMKYAADCEAIFGYFLHHFPYSGLLGEEDEAHRHQSGDRMQQLYEATFGEDYIRAEHAVLAWVPLAPHNAWSNPTVGEAALQGSTAKTAWSNPTINPVKSLQSAKIAWSNPTINTSATLRGATAKIAWSNPTIDTSPKTKGHTARIAWSNPTVGKSVSQPAANAIMLWTPTARRVSHATAEAA